MNNTFLAANDKLTSGLIDTVNPTSYYRNWKRTGSKPSWVNNYIEPGIIDIFNGTILNQFTTAKTQSFHFNI